MLTFKVLKYDPQDKNSKPRFVRYSLEEAHSMTIFLALNFIREKFDSDLSFDFVCRAGICGSCGMMINGVPRLACRTLTASFENPVITVMPMPGFKLLKDLSVDTGQWFSEMTKRVESWVHSNKHVDFNVLEDRVEPVVADNVFELDRCVECGICVASCGTKLMRENFIAPAGLNRVARFMADPYDDRSEEDFYDIVGNDDGIFGCMTLLACHDNCPKHIPFQSQLAYVRRRMVKFKDK